MNGRFKEVRLHTGLNQSEFGERIGVTRDTIANIEGNRMKIKPLHINAVCKEFGINETWLLTGEGEMHEPPSRQQEIAQLVAKLATLNMEDPSDQLLYDIEMWLGKLPKSVWDEFLVFMKEEIPKLNLK